MNMKDDLFQTICNKKTGKIMLILLQSKHQQHWLEQSSKDKRRRGGGKEAFLDWNETKTYSVVATRASP